MQVGIVGAGITGLALTHYLSEQGIESTAFEAGTEAGGVIQSKCVNGHRLEVGPQRMRKTPGIAALAEAADIGDAFVEANHERLFVYADSSLGEVPFSARALLRTDLLSRSGKLRLLSEPLTYPGHPAETAEQLFVRKFGREAYEKFVGPLYGGIYGSDPAAMPAAFALDSLLEREQETGSFLRAILKRLGQGQRPPPVSFEKGNQQLPNALADTYRNRIEFDTSVLEIEQLSGSETGYSVHTPAGRSEFDHVVVTTPADVASDLLEGHVEGASQLDALRYNPLALVFLQADTDREGFGYQVGYGEDLHTLGVSWNDSMFDREGVHTAFLGGMHEPELLEEDDETLGSIASEEFETAMDVPADVLEVSRLDVGFPAWDQSWWNLEDVETPDGITLATNYTERMGVPSRVREARQLAAELADE